VHFSTAPPLSDNLSISVVSNNALHCILHVTVAFMVVSDYICVCSHAEARDDYALHRKKYLNQLLSHPFASHYTQHFN
jgi:hypothetical protein